MMLIMACELAGILLRIIVVISCYINSIYFPYLLPCLLKLLEFFPCNHSLFCFPSKISSCPCLFQCSQPFSIFLLFAMKSLPSFQFHNQPFPFPTFLSHFFPSLEHFPHVLNSTFLDFSKKNNFILCFVFSLPPPRFVSLMFRFSKWHPFLHPPGADDGQRRYDSCLACDCERIGHVSGRDEALQIVLSSPCLNLPPAEGMASFRKETGLSSVS